MCTWLLAKEISCIWLFPFSLWLPGNSDLNMLLCYTNSMRSMACMFSILLSLGLDHLEQWSLTFWHQGWFRGRRFFHVPGLEMGGWFQDDSSALNILCILFLLSLHQLHLRSSDIRSEVGDPWANLYFYLVSIFNFLHEFFPLPKIFSEMRLHIQVIPLLMSH